MQELVKRFIQAGAQDKTAEMTQCIHLVGMLERLFHARLGQEMPEAAGAQVKEGQGHAAAPLGQHDIPISSAICLCLPALSKGGKGLAQLGGDLDQVGCEPALGEQVQHREQQKRLVRNLAAGGKDPMCSIEIMRMKGFILMAEKKRYYN